MNKNTEIRKKNRKLFYYPNSKQVQYVNKRVTPWVKLAPDY